MRRKTWTYCSAALLIAWSVAQGSRTEVAAAQKGPIPTFQVDASWPKLPGKMTIGAVAGIYVDSKDHIWILQRPQTIPKLYLQAASTPPRADCCVAGPPVMEFDAAGNYIQGWGGKGDGYDWPETEHGIYVDYKDNVWIAGSASLSGAYAAGAGNSALDAQLLKFTRNGKFVLQVGKPKASQGSNDTENFGRATDMRMDQKTNELYVTDGYQNRRVIVLDGDTGKYKRLWGAYGAKPDDSIPHPKDAGTGPPSKQFNTPHTVALSNDGLVYIGDRSNYRVQVFKLDGTFVKEGFVARGLGNGSTGGFGFSTDKQQKFLYSADSGNSIMWILNRDTLEVVGQMGRFGSQAGQWCQLHMLAVSSKGDVYTGEVCGNRVQKFVYKGLSSATSSQ